MILGNSNMVLFLTFFLYSLPASLSSVSYSINLSKSFLVHSLNFMVGSILLALVFFMSSQTGTVLYVPFETSVFVPQNRGIRFMNFRAQICKNKIHFRRISTCRVEVWALFRPGVIINFSS